MNIKYLILILFLISVRVNAASVYETEIEKEPSAFVNGKKSSVYQAEISAMLRKNAQTQKTTSTEPVNDDFKTISDNLNSKIYNNVYDTSKTSLFDNTNDDFIEFSVRYGTVEQRAKSSLLENYAQNYENEGGIFYNDCIFIMNNIFNFQKLWEAYPNVTINLSLVFSIWLMIKVLIKIITSKS